MIKKDPLAGREKVKQLLREEGPILPMRVCNELQTNTWIASAMLSELSSAGFAKISNLKVGGSPLYYVEGQEVKLQDYAHRLNEKERKAYDLLKEKKVLRDSELSPLNRVALSHIKDFAFPLEIVYDGNSEVFWKWYLTSEDEARSIIGIILEGGEVQAASIESSPLANELVKNEELGAGVVQPDSEALKDIKSGHDKIIQPVELQKSVHEVEEVSEIVSKKKVKEKQAKKPKRVSSKKKAAESLKVVEEKKHDEAIQDDMSGNLTGFSVSDEEPKDGVKELPKDEFVEMLMDFFNENKIEVTQSEVIKKGTEIDFLLGVDSAVGKVMYYCKARKKKRINEGDLSVAFIQGQFRKLPVLFLTTGDFDNKAQEMLKKEFKTIAVKKL